MGHTQETGLCFRGGLDVQKDQTGSHSVYTTFEEHEIMFHVSTMLPYSKEDRQQVSVRQQIDVILALSMLKVYRGRHPVSRYVLLSLFAEVPRVCMGSS